MLGAPELDAGLQVGSHQGGAEGQNPLPQSAGHTSLDAAQDTVGTLVAHVLYFISCLTFLKSLVFLPY